jgi:amyloid beta precursor protein binding protein 1
MRSGDDENFDEAINSVLRSCQPTVVPSAIKAIFSDPKCETLTAEVPYLSFVHRILLSWFMTILP